jgi:hypothetical protein
MTAESVPAPLRLESLGRLKGSRRYEIRHNKTVSVSIGQDVLKTDVGWPRVIPSGNGSIWEAAQSSLRALASGAPPRQNLTGLTGLTRGLPAWALALELELHRFLRPEIIHPIHYRTMSMFPQHITASATISNVQ